MNGNIRQPAAEDLRPIAFMVMPFRKRPVPNAPEGAPHEVDFDSLWDHALQPALEQLGYIAIRADFETGTVIIKDMLERLAFADLVLADLTLPNGNVYYEVGIRHVAQRTSCVLISADWSRQLFDVDQMRTLRYPLPDGAVPPASAEEIKRVLVAKLPAVRDSATPYYELVTHKEAAGVFRKQVETISSFQTEVRAARMLPTVEERRERVASLVECYTGPCLEIPEVALELLTLVRDCGPWTAVLQFVEKLPEALQNQGVVKEQALLARAKLGDDQSAITQLEELIRLRGESPERLGLIGGRYKSLWRKRRDERKMKGEAYPDLLEQGYLDSAIDNYRSGMCLDLNEYFCVGNLPGLLRARGGAGDEEEALFLDRLTQLAAQLKLARCQDDVWARSSLLGTAFRMGDVAEVARLAREVAKEGPACWQLKTTLQDITDTLEALQPSESRQQLVNYRDQLATLLRE